MINKDIKYSYNDLSLIPAKISSIESRSECNPYRTCSAYEFTKQGENTEVLDRTPQ